MASESPYVPSISEFERRVARAAGYPDPDVVSLTHEAPPLLATQLISVLADLERHGDDDEDAADAGSASRIEQLSQLQALQTLLESFEESDEGHAGGALEAVRTALAALVQDHDAASPAGR